MGCWAFAGKWFVDERHVEMDIFNGWPTVCPSQLHNNGSNLLCYLGHSQQAMTLPSAICLSSPDKITLEICFPKAPPGKTDGPELRKKKK